MCIRDRFVSVAVDGNTVDGTNYKVTEGSTIVTFTSGYLSALSVGTHTVVINFIDGAAATSLTLSKASDGSKPDGDNNTGTTDVYKRQGREGQNSSAC